MDGDLQIEVDEDLTVLANTIEDWAAPRQSSTRSSSASRSEGICKAISCTSNGLDVELHHIVLH